MYVYDGQAGEERQWRRLKCKYELHKVSRERGRTKEGDAKEKKRIRMEIENIQGRQQRTRNVE